MIFLALRFWDLTAIPSVFGSILPKVDLFHSLSDAVSIVFSLFGFGRMDVGAQGRRRGGFGEGGSQWSFHWVILILPSRGRQGWD